MQQTVSVILKLVDKFSGPTKKVGGGIGSLIKGMAYLNQAAQLVIGSVRAVAGAFQALTKDLIDTISKFRNVQIGIAGTLSAFELVGDFAEGQRVASDLFGLMEKLAAPLPGSVDDFLSVFQRSLPKAIEAFRVKGKGSLAEIADFTSRFAAVAIANNVSAAQAAADLPRLLGGHAGAHVIAYRKMSGLFSKAASGLGLMASNAKEFNKLNPGQRLAVLQKVIKLSSGTIEAFSHTTDAAEGTLESVVASLKRVMGQPVYDAYMRSISAVTRILRENEPLVKSIANVLGTTLSKGFGGALNAVTNLGNALATVPLLQDLFALFRGGGAGVAATIGGAMGVFGDAAINGFTQVVALVSAAGSLLAPVLSVLAMGLSFTVAQIQIFGGYLSAVWSTIATQLLPVFGFLWARINDFLVEIRPVFASLVTSATEIGTALGQLVSPIIGVLGLALGGLVTIAKYTVIPALSLLAIVIKGFAGAVVSVVNWLAKYVPGMQRISLGTASAAAVTGDKALSAGVTRDLFAGMGKGADGAHGKKKKKGKSKQTFDFRHSRFDITQQFAEGYDPDRIAVGFASDLAKLGEMRTQSNLAPVFALR